MEITSELNDQKIFKLIEGAQRCFGERTFDHAINNCNEVLALDPSNVEAQKILNSVQIENFINFVEDSFTNSKEKVVSALKNLIRNPRDNNRIATAMEEFNSLPVRQRGDQLIHKHLPPKDCLALFCLAVDHQSNNQIEEATITWKLVEKCDCKYSKLIVSLILYLFPESDREELCEELLDIAPDAFDEKKLAEVEKLSQRIENYSYNLWLDDHISGDLYADKIMQLIKGYLAVNKVSKADKLYREMLERSRDMGGALDEDWEKYEWITDFAIALAENSFHSESLMIWEEAKKFLEEEYEESEGLTISLRRENGMFFDTSDRAANYIEVLENINDVSIVITKKQARLEAEMRTQREMLAFLTHMLGNTLSTGPSIAKKIFKLVSKASDKHEDDLLKMALSNSISIMTTLSLSRQLIDTFKLYSGDPNEIMPTWQKDTGGGATIELLFASVLLYEMSDLFLRVQSFANLDRLARAYAKEDSTKLVEHFTDEFLSLELSEDSTKTIFQWIKENFPAIQIKIMGSSPKFNLNGIRFNYLYTCLSELVHNAIKYSDAQQPIALEWILEKDFFVFTCKNSFSPESTKVSGSKKGLNFLQSFTKTLKEIQLSHETKGNVYTSKLQIPEKMLQE